MNYVQGVAQVAKKKKKHYLSIFRDNSANVWKKLA